MITYKIDEKIYINLTNRCSNNCEFCVRINDSYSDYSLWLKEEPTSAEVIAELGDLAGVPEVVFCGYGEPLYRLESIIEISEYVHKLGKKTRLNSNGQASLIIGSGVAERLKGKIDTVSISLNASDATKYQKICQCEFGEAGFTSLIEFAKDCKEHIGDVRLSIVDVVGKEEIVRAQALADSIGVKLKVREYIA
ncbi:MAG: TatD family nuclease-associated radical SAM protein [Bacillota bacterium]